MKPTDTIGSDVQLYRGCVLDVLPHIPDGSVDAVITDPPYAEIDRPYGRLTERQWFALMDPVVEHCRRVLKPTGSAVFVIQPNSERVGRMRPWVFEFMAKWCREWNMVQDVYWWNPAAMPGDLRGLTRASLKACVWLGESDCHRDQDAVLWTESQANQALRSTARCGRMGRPSGHSVNERRISERALERGGVTPFNVLPFPNTNSSDSAGSNGHGAGTPFALCDWWVRYICPPDGVVLDPFMGSGTVGLATKGRDFVGIERDHGYYATARRRLLAATGGAPDQLFAGVV